MKDIVRLTTQDVSKAIPVTDSLIVSEKTNKDHRVILQLIKKYNKDLKEFGQVTSEMRLIEFGTRTQEIEIVLLNEGQATFLITLMRNTPEVLKFKKDLVKAFLFLKNEMLARKEVRSIGISVRKDLQAAIKNYVTDPESRFKNFAYSNYTRLVYRKVLGKEVKKVKEEKGLGPSDNLRDNLTLDQLKQVQDLESKIATYIEFTDTAGKTDKEIFQEIKKVLDN